MLRLTTDREALGKATISNPCINYTTIVLNTQQYQFKFNG